MEMAQWMDRRLRCIFLFGCCAYVTPFAAADPSRVVEETQQVIEPDADGPSFISTVTVTFDSDKQTKTHLHRDTETSGSISLPRLALISKSRFERASLVPTDRFKARSGRDPPYFRDLSKGIPFEIFRRGGFLDLRLVFFCAIGCCQD
ncbi:MAG TPA: hypothetical protein VIU12_08070 [Chryseolinea sp.]